MHLFFTKCRESHLSDQNAMLPVHLLTRYKHIIMRVFILSIFLTITSLLQAKEVKSQDLSKVYLSLQVKNGDLKTAFKKIESQTVFRFTYKSEDISKYKNLNFSAANQNVAQILANLLKGTNLSYEQVDNAIIIKETTPKNETEKPVKQEVKVAPPNGYNITGTVTDSLTNPLIGATVILSGTKYATVTDDEGQFTLTSVPNGKYTLSISYIGDQKLSFPVEVAGNDVIFYKLVMRTNANSLKEVIVSTGYQTLPQERATGSFAQPDKEVYDDRISTDVISKLEGITSGLVFNRNTSGQPSLQIRTLGTINAATTPLIVVDNFPYDGNINNLNPNDIASVTVLKDAAAASIWGAQAGNGVIVITTKKGNRNQPLRIDFTANYTLSGKPNLDYNRNFLDSKDFISVEENLFNQGYYTSELNNTTINYPESPVIEILNQEKNGTLSSVAANAQIAALGNIDVRQGLSKYFYQGIANQQYGLNFSGGGQNVNYEMSVGYDHDLSDNQVGDANTRLTTHAFLSFNPIKNLEINGGIDYVKNNTAVNSILGQLSTFGPDGKGLLPYMQFADGQGNPLPLLKNYADSFTQAAQSNGFLNWQYYPLVEKDLQDNTSQNNDVRLRTGLKYTFIPGLNISANYQYEYGVTNNDQYFSQDSYYERNLINEFSIVSSGKVTGNNIPVGGILQTGSNNYVSNDGRIQLNFNHDFNVDNNVTALAGVEERQVTG
ncbi:MAG: carboxypeptidase-like regulatory domain-containing protein, partial [Bacteroidetes bacterium]|nr:carboxypeptidase-like regulatory domain-containing protein [Bacteroidota bacterium]